MKSGYFSQRVQKLTLPISSEGGIIERESLYGNYIGNGNGCTTIDYVLYHSGMAKRDMYQSIESMDYGTLQSSPQFHWYLFQKVDYEYLQIDESGVENYGTSPDYPSHEVLSIVFKEDENLWPNNAFAFVAITEDDGFWATWDPRCQ